MHFVGVHAGAGYSSPSKDNALRGLLRRSCELGANILKSNGSAYRAAVEVMKTLEDNPLTNAGLGSNLTVEGTVECDASIMFSGYSIDGIDCSGLPCRQPEASFGGVGAVSGIRNPIVLAAKVLENSVSGPLKDGREPPIFLAGEGARQFARSHGIDVDSLSLETNQSRKRFREHRELLKTTSLSPAREMDGDHDTVGVICVDAARQICAAVSSGGLSMKTPGRVGEAGLIGTGAWATDYPVSAAVSCSGTGEHLMKCVFGSRFCSSLSLDKPMEAHLLSFFNDHFLRKDKQFRRLGGVITCMLSSDGVEFGFAHSTPSMSLGYFGSGMSKPRTMISRLPDEEDSGFVALVSSTFLSCCDPPGVAEEKLRERQ